MKTAVIPGWARLAGSLCAHHDHLHLCVTVLTPSLVREAPGPPTMWSVEEHSESEDPLGHMLTRKHELCLVDSARLCGLIDLNTCLYKS